MENKHLNKKTISTRSDLRTKTNWTCHRDTISSTLTVRDKDDVDTDRVRCINVVGCLVRSTLLCDIDRTVNAFGCVPDNVFLIVWFVWEVFKFVRVFYVFCILWLWLLFKVCWVFYVFWVCLKVYRIWFVLWGFPNFECFVGFLKF